MDRTDLWHTPPGGCESDRLWLRPAGLADADDLIEVLRASQAHLAPWVPLPDRRPEPGPLRARLARAEAGFAAGERLHFAVRLNPGGELVGWVAATWQPERGGFALSYWLGAGWTGRGLAGEAVALLCDLILERSRADLIEIACRIDNRRSAAVARRAGFVRKGTAGAIDLWCLTRGLVEAWRVARLAAGDDGVVTRDADGALHVRGADGAGIDVTAGRSGGVVVVIDVAGQAGLSPRELLARNLRLELGAFCLRGDRVVLRHAGPSELLDEDRLDGLLEQAARLRGRAGAVGRGAEPVFAAYAE